MKKYLLLSAILTCFLQGHSHNLSAVETTFSLSADYTKGKLTENIHYDGQIARTDVGLLGAVPVIPIQGPVKHSQKYSAFGPKAKFAMLLENNFCVEASADYSWLISKVSEEMNPSNILVNGIAPAGPYSPLAPKYKRSVSKSGYLTNIRGVVGYKWDIAEMASITPYVGFAQHTLRVGRYQDFSELRENSSKQRVSWKEPLIGFKADWNFIDQYSLSINLEYRFSKGRNSLKNKPTAGNRYMATGKRKGQAIIFDLGFGYSINEQFNLDLSYQYSTRRAQIKNEGKYYSSFPNSIAKIKNKLREKNHQWSLGLSYSF